MASEPKKPEGTFGSFLEKIKNEPTFPPPAEYDTTPEELEEGIVQLLALLKHENGVPVLVDDLYERSGLRLRLFGEALKVMIQEGLIDIQADDQITLAAGIQDQL